MNIHCRALVGVAVEVLIATSAVGQSAEPSPFEGRIRWSVTTVSVPEPEVILAPELIQKYGLAGASDAELRAFRDKLEKESAIQREEFRAKAPPELVRSMDANRERLNTQAKEFADAQVARRGDRPAGPPNELILTAREGSARVAAKWGPNYAEEYVARGQDEVSEKSANAGKPVVLVWKSDPKTGTFGLEPFAGEPIRTDSPLRTSFTKTNDRLTYKGFACIRYEVVIRLANARPNPDAGMTKYSVWSTTEIQANVLPLHRLNFGFGALGNTLRLIPGVPLAIENSRGLRILATEIVPEKVDPAVFAVSK